MCEKVKKSSLKVLTSDTICVILCMSLKVALNIVYNTSKINN